MTDIQVTGTRVGGAFGGKGIITIEPIAAMLARKAGSRGIEEKMS
jgi:CO/xanthine dehydrogenase Mo-binding subunit